MAGTKRWLAAFLAGVLLFFCAAAPAEGGGRDTVEIQESMVSREDSTEKTLEDHLFLLLELTQSEEIRNLLQIKDVQTIATEVIVKILIWMARNRPVTMKILAELGIGETDLYCIGELWDSAERIRAVIREYEASEDRISLAEEFQALSEDPEIRDILEDLLRIFSSVDLLSLIRSAAEPDASGEASVSAEGPLAQKLQDRNLDENSFLGSLLMELMRTLDQNGWEPESLTVLLQNENVWRFLRHLAFSSAEVNLAFLQEYRKLSADPKVKAFVRRTFDACTALTEKTLHPDPPVPEESAEEAPKENTP